MPASTNERFLAPQSAGDRRHGNFEGLFSDFARIRVGGRVVEFPQGGGPLKGGGPALTGFSAIPVTLVAP